MRDYEIYRNVRKTSLSFLNSVLLTQKNYLTTHYAMRASNVCNSNRFFGLLVHHVYDSSLEEARQRTIIPVSP